MKRILGGIAILLLTAAVAQAAPTLQQPSPIQVQEAIKNSPQRANLERFGYVLIEQRAPDNTLIIWGCGKAGGCSLFDIYTSAKGKEAKHGLR